MATERPTSGNVPAASSDDYQAIPKPTTSRVNPEARFPATCMMWTVVVGMGILVAIVLCWAISSLGTINWGLMFK